MILHEYHGHQIDPREVAAFYWQALGDDRVALCCALRQGAEFLIVEVELDKSMRGQEETAKSRGAKLCSEADVWLRARLFQ